MRCMYFAYGSNLHPLRLQARVPSARLLGTTVLPDHKILFGKQGMDGSGKCSVTPCAGGDQQVHGALFEMAYHERDALDRAEGPDYQRMRATFALSGSVVDAFYYEARVLDPDALLHPFSWYRELVLAGARFHAFPARYISKLAAAQGIPDPDQDRAASMADLLARLSID